MVAFNIKSLSLSIIDFILFINTKFIEPVNLTSFRFYA